MLPATSCRNCAAGLLIYIKLSIIGRIVIAQDRFTARLTVVKLARKSRPPKERRHCNDENQRNGQEQQQRSFHGSLRQTARACQAETGTSPGCLNKRQALSATASDETSMLIAASQGCTQPSAASGIISRCQTMEP